VEDGNDVAAIRNAVASGPGRNRKTLADHRLDQIAYGSPNKQGSADAHGGPWGWRRSA
jgi:transketolase